MYKYNFSKPEQEFQLLICIKGNDHDYFVFNQQDSISEFVCWKGLEFGSWKGHYANNNNRHTGSISFLYCQTID